MAKAAAVFVLALALLGGSASRSFAFHGGGFHGGFHHGGFHHGGFHHGFGHHGFRSRVFIGVGPFWGAGWPYWGPPYYWGAWGPYPYYYGYPYAGATFLMEQQPQTYIQQQPPPATTQYWYYCASAKAYYPRVAECPEPWVKVPPTPQ
jgi:hypothetical protein